MRDNGDPSWTADPSYGGLEKETPVEVGRAGPFDDPDEPFPWDHIAPRRIEPGRWAAFEGGYVAEIFQALGMNLDTPGTHRTPERFLRALFDSTSGYEGDANLVTAFPTNAGRARLLAQPGDRGADSLLRPLRAPRPALLRRGARGVRAARTHHRQSPS